MLSTADWLTMQRMRAAAFCSIAATLLAIIYLAATATGTLDAWGRPLGTDFSNVWTAGKMASDGSAALAWDWNSHHAVQVKTHGDPAVPFYGWHYPPPFLMLAALLAQLPYLAALIIWQATTLAAALLLVRKILPSRHALLMAASAPVVFVCLLHGHNGFLTAALLGGGLLLLERRPFLAGVLFGCLIYKPHLGLLIPAMLLLGRHWRAIGGASSSAAILIGLTLLFWGFPVWQAFVDSLALTRTVVIESGNTGWEKIQSVFGMMRMWGAPVGPAYAIQSAASAGAVAAALWLGWRAAPALRNAGVTAAAILSTPYVLDYDFVILGIGCAFLIVDAMRRGFLDFEKSLLVLVWAAPLFARQLGEYLFLPLGQASALIVLILALRRARYFDARQREARLQPQAG